MSVAAVTCRGVGGTQRLVERDPSTVRVGVGGGSPISWGSLVCLHVVPSLLTSREDAPQHLIEGTWLLFVGEGNLNAFSSLDFITGREGVRLLCQGSLGNRPLDPPDGNGKLQGRAFCVSTDQLFILQRGS